MDARCHLVPCKVVFKTVRKYIQEKSHTMFKLAYKLLKKNAENSIRKKKKGEFRNDEIRRKGGMEIFSF